MLWKLKKPLNGLKDSSQKFWLKVKERLLCIDLKLMPGDEAFYCLNKDGVLKGTVLTLLINIFWQGMMNY